MKFYNKEWYELMQNTDYSTENIRELPNKKYSDKEIKEIYNEELEKEINIAYEEFNTPPDFSEILEEIMDEDYCFNSEDWVVLEEGRSVRKAESKEEVVKSLLEEEKQALEEFENRGTFNKKEVIKDFKKMYKMELKYKYEFPKWLYDEVDNRLIALKALPKDVLDKLRKEEKVNKEKFNKIEEEADRILKKQKLSYDIINNFNFHDYPILGFNKVENGYEMVLENYESEIIKVLFENAENIELEKLNFKDCYFLYDEIYSVDGGYEVHMMVESKGLKYVTLRCRDIKFFS